MRPQVSVHALDRRLRLVWGGERDHAARAREPGREPGVLHHRRPPGSEVADRALAEPAASGRDVRLLGDAELARRAADVFAVGAEILGDVSAVADSPAGCAQLAPDVVVG